MEKIDRLHVISSVNLNENVHSIVFWDSIDGILDRPEVAGAANVDGNEAVADGSNPVVVVSGCVVRRRSRSRSRRFG